jgi:hypothetical protein
LDPTLSSLARSIGHVFDHSLKPTSKTRKLPPSAYTLGSVHRVQDITSPVAFRTHFARDGWGLRTLTSDEIGVAFGLSLQLRLGACNSTGFPLPPVQGLVGWLGSLTSKGYAKGSLPAPLRQILSTPATSTWFPTIARSLSHNWIDEGTVLAKAVKHDDAKVPIQLWNNRVLMLYPYAHQLLHEDTELLRTLCLQTRLLWVLATYSQGKVGVAIAVGTQ